MEGGEEVGGGGGGGEEEEEEPRPVEVGEAGPLGLDGHPLGPGGGSPSLVNLRQHVAFFRKA